MKKFPGIATLPFRGAAAALALALLQASSLCVPAEATAVHAEVTGLAAIKSYLVGKVTTMDKASHDFVTNAAAYEKIVKASGITATTMQAVAQEMAMSCWA